MVVSAITNTAPQYNPSFGHAVRVCINVKKPGEAIYNFVNPVQNSVLYKKLNSRIVSWLNSDIITALRTHLGKKSKVTKQQSPNESIIKQNLVNDLVSLDTDYKKLKMARSVYSRYHLGFIATGCDVPIIENIVGTALFGSGKRGGNGEHSSIARQIHNSTMKYIQHPINRLKENGKEIMLYLNFIITGTNKQGQNIYELENYEFRRILKSLPLYNRDNCSHFYELKQTNAFEEEIAASIQHLKNQILRKK